MLWVTVFSWSNVPSALVNEPRLERGMDTPVSRSVRGDADAMRAKATITRVVLQNMVQMCEYTSDSRKAELCRELDREQRSAGGDW